MGEGVGQHVTEWCGGAGWGEARGWGRLQTLRPSVVVSILFSVPLYIPSVSIYNFHFLTMHPP